MQKKRLLSVQARQVQLKCFSLCAAVCIFSSMFSARATGQVPAIVPGSKQLRVAFYMLNPWLEVIGSDSPVFALYADGTAIFAKGTETEELKYYSAKLTSSQVEHIYSLLGALQNNTSYALSNATDLPDNRLIWIGAGNTKNSVSVYGNLRQQALPIHEHVSKTFKERSYLSILEISPREELPIPDHVSKAFLELAAFDAENAKPWLPDYIELMLTPGGAPGGVEWPHGWPDLNDRLTKERRKGNYSIFLPSSRLAELRTLFPEKNIARINDKSWCVYIRYPFPSESTLYPRGLAHFQPQ